MIQNDCTKFIIYIVRSPSNKVYIGYTSKTLSERKAGHEGDAKWRRNKLPFHKAILKYGDSMAWQTLHDNINSIEEAHELEKHYIVNYQSSNKTKGYNCTLGGDGFTPNEEFKKAHSQKTSLAMHDQLFDVFKKSDKSLVGTYRSPSECSKALDISAIGVSHCLLGYKSRLSHKGYIFKYQ
jgi:predicted GIY-YIG superfamily endonuclease